MNEKKMNERLKQAELLLHAGSYKKGVKILYETSNHHLTYYQAKRKRYLLKVAALVKQYGKNWQEKFNAFLVRMMIAFEYVDYTVDGNDYTILHNHYGEFNLDTNGQLRKLDHDTLLQEAWEIYFSAYHIKRNKHGHIVYFKFGGIYENNETYEVEGELYAPIQ